MSINSFDELPDHIIAAMSHAERNYHRALLDGPHIGAGYRCAIRCRPRETYQR